MPIFSIILPTYDRAKLLARAVQSVVEQSFKDWELIVIDDGSSDNTKDVIAKFEDNRIKYFYQKNKGRSISRNNGIIHSDGDWICFLDSDDCYISTHLEVFNICIQSDPKSTVYKTGVQFINEKGNVIFKSLYKSANDNALKFFSTNYCSILDLCISKNVAKNSKFENVSTWEDKAYILDLLKNNNIYQIHKRTVTALEHNERSVLKVHENPTEINTVLQLMSNKLTEHNASNYLISFVQQNFLLSVLIDAQKLQYSSKSIKSLVMQLYIKPTWQTSLKLLKARVFNT